MDFFAYDRTASKILGVEGGTGNLAHLIAEYDKSYTVYRKLPSNPVIILIDSDSGATPILKVVKNKFGKDIKLSSPDAFHYLCRNLYLVLAPVPAGLGSSCIEDCFEPTLLGTKLNGKSFNPTNFDASATEHGKFYFAEYVVRPIKQTVVITGFATLLARLDAACADYAARQLQSVISNAPVLAVSVATP